MSAGTTATGSDRVARPGSGAAPIGVGVVVMVVSGVALAGQGRINGALGQALGSVLVASLVSFLVGTAMLAATVVVRPRSRAALGRLRREHVRPDWWFGGLYGGLLVSMTTLGVPLVGVALVSVATVTGGTVGGLVVDRVGLGPSGRHGITPARLAGTVLAVVAVALSALHGGSREVRPLLLLGLTVAGVGSALQPAANGHLRRIGGDAFAAALVSFAVGDLALALVVAGMAAAGHLDALRWSADAWLYVGGLAGAVYVVLAAALVDRLGVLRVTLAVVAGQLTGAVVLDRLAPVPGARLTWWTVAGVALTLVAVAVASSARGASRRTAAPAGESVEQEQPAGESQEQEQPVGSREERK